MFGWNETAWFSVFAGVAFKSTALLGGAWIAAFLLRGRSAALRHLVWTAAAAAVLALPFLALSLPALPVPAVAGLLPPSTRIVADAMAAAPRDATSNPQPAAPGYAAASQPTVWRAHWRNWLMLLWAAGAAAVFARTLVAGTAMWRVRRSAKPFSDRHLCGALSQALGIRHTVDVLETGAGSMPMTFGVLRSAILLPSDAARWSDERRHAVLMHELAHVRRGDVATHFLARMAFTLYWWNPLAWMAWREFLKERERATDDVVLNAGARPSEYASHLLEVARTMQSASSIGWAAVAMARRSQLEGRLLAILDSGVNRKTPGRAAACVAALLALGMAAPLAAVRAQESPDEARQAIPVDVDATIRAARSQKNYEMLETAAHAAVQLRKYDVARKLLESAVAIRSEVAGEGSVEYGVGLLKLADLAREEHGNSEVLYKRAALVLGDHPEAARALISLGTAAITKKQFPQATDYFQRAQRVDPTHAGSALMWMAVVERLQYHYDEAEALYKSALSVQDEKSPDGVLTIRIYAQFLRKQGRESEANQLDDRVAAIQKANAKPAPAASKDVYRVGGGVSAPSVLQKVDPEYTEEARAAMLSGTEVVQVEIWPDGMAHNGRVVRGLGLGLDEKGLEAVSQWKFKPGTKDGRPVTVAATIEINWRLQ